MSKHTHRGEGEGRRWSGTGRKKRVRASSKTKKPAAPYHPNLFPLPPLTYPRPPPIPIPATTAISSPHLPRSLGEVLLLFSPSIASAAQKQATCHTYRYMCISYAAYDRQACRREDRYSRQAHCRSLIRWYPGILRFFTHSGGLK